jgi:hypothetical protein
MATVVDLSGNAPHGAGPENKLDSVNRTVAAVSGSITPAYVGEIASDLAADQNYVGTGTSANTDWAVDNS